MIGVFTSEQVRAAERCHQRELDDGSLMARASFAVAQAVIDHRRAIGHAVPGTRVVLLVGGGNNGADALFAGARLAGRGMRVDAVLVTDRAHSTGSQALLDAGGRLHRSTEAVAPLLDAADVIVDGMLGIGADGALREPAAGLAVAANAAEAFVIAVDLPSGVDGDTGSVPGVAIQADATITFAGCKPGLLLAPGAQLAGRVTVVDIGVGDALVDPIATVLERPDVAAWMPRPAFADYKYRRGVLGIVAGSPAYPGAAVLCTTAALAGPTGMTMILDRGDHVADLVIARHPEVVRTARLEPSRATAWVGGPGLVADAEDEPLICAILDTSAPVVLDAGALSVLARSTEVRQRLAARVEPTVLTPHDGEFTRLGGALGPDRRASALDLAGRLGAVIVLKGPGTVIAAPDGTCVIDQQGSPALATAGSGDVLSGCLGSVLAHASAAGRLGSWGQVARAAAAACWAHGEAGRQAAGADRLVTAVDLVSALPAAVASTHRTPGFDGAAAWSRSGTISR